MVLEKLVRWAKITTTNKGMYAVPAVMAVGIGCALADGKIDEKDIVPLALAGTVASMGGLVAAREHRDYNKIQNYSLGYNI